MRYAMWFNFDHFCLSSNTLRLFIALMRHFAVCGETVLLIFCGFKQYFLIWR